MSKMVFLWTIFMASVTLGDVLKGKINLKKIAAEINSNPKSTWKADHYGNTIIEAEELVKTKLGLILPINLEDLGPHTQINRLFSTVPRKKNVPKFGSSLFHPTSYDAREKYPECKSIGLIRDQSNCGSCWAVSAASVFSDRLCIQSIGYYNLLLSGQYTLSCDKVNDGCNGGYLDQVWKFYKENGCITGGEFESDVGCQPYELKHCGRYPRKYPCSSPSAITPKCHKTRCTNEWYEYAYERYIFTVSDYYQVGDEYITIFNEFLIKQEILTNGPVQAGFLVYADFFTYKSGVYKRKGFYWENIVGAHAVKIIGWGVEKGVKYWLVANSWQEDWGEKGLFKIVRGENNCLLESWVFAGNPNLENYDDDNYYEN